jgi:hypothetical protein
MNEDRKPFPKKQTREELIELRVQSACSFNLCPRTHVTLPTSITTEEQLTSNDLQHLMKDNLMFSLVLKEGTVHLRIENLSNEDYPIKGGDLLNYLKVNK